MGDNLADPRNRDREIHLGEAKEMVHRRVEKGDGPSDLSDDETYKRVLRSITSMQEENSPTGEMVKEAWIDEAFAQLRDHGEQ